MTRIGLISTRDTNIGDDLIRTGIERLLGATLGEGSPEYLRINKHRPLEVFHDPRPVALVDRLPRGQRTATRLAGTALRALAVPHRLRDMDFVVQCGTPMMWPQVHRAEWISTLWRDVLARPGGPPVLNLGAGSCYPWLDPRRPRLTTRDARALTTILSACRRHTFRDALAGEIAADLGFDGVVLPCPAMHWAHGERPAPDAEAVILNVMPTGGHFHWGQEAAGEHWQAELDTVVGELGREHPLILLCHDRREEELAAARWPAHERHLVRSAEDYLAVVRRGRAGLVNRMHAAVALAGLGIPAVAVGTDTRMLMVRTVGQPTLFLPDASATRMLEAVHALLADRDGAGRRLRAAELDAFAAHRLEVEAFLGLSKSRN